MARRFIFEHKHQPILSQARFYQRMFLCGRIALALLLGALSLGTVAYHFLDHQSWIDSLLNAVMIMSGLGLVNGLITPAAKLFTVFYALFSAFVFYTTLAIIFSPILHRFLHHFHLDNNKEE